MKPCLDCGQLSDEARCPVHRRAQNREREARPGRALYRDPVYLRNRALLLAGNPPCYRPDCDQPATTADHIIPIRHGGTNALSNLRPACRPHNSDWRHGT